MTELVPAATVVVLRDGDDGLEVLMVRRNASLAFAGGMWVFPGGRIDPDDHPTATADLTDPDMVLAAARRAAVREAHEEAGLELAEEELNWFAHWTPPERAGTRFATWFFVTAAPLGLEHETAVISVDGGEIVEHAWMRPADAHRRRDALDLELSPPTWISLWQLLPFATTAEAIAALGAREPEYFATRIAVRDHEVVLLYAGDAGYDDLDPERLGGHHRLRMAADGWVYERPSG